MNCEMQYHFESVYLPKKESLQRMSSTHESDAVEINSYFEYLFAENKQKFLPYHLKRPKQTQQSFLPFVTLTFDTSALLFLLLQRL